MGGRCSSVATEGKGKIKYFEYSNYELMNYLGIKIQDYMARQLVIIEYSKYKINIFS
jgi:hypothetical protein